MKNKPLVIKKLVKVEASVKSMRGLEQAALVFPLFRIYAAAGKPEDTSFRAFSVLASIQSFASSKILSMELFTLLRSASESLSTASSSSESILKVTVLFFDFLGISFLSMGKTMRTRIRYLQTNANLNTSFFAGLYK